MKIHEMQTSAYNMAVTKGWWPAPPVVQDGRIANYERISSALALIHGEVSEALEELRDSTCIDAVRYDPARGNKPEGFGVELADIVLRVADLAGACGIDLQYRIEEKLAYNATREHRHGGRPL
ncbi:MAG: hypothetical protein IPG46_19220 [Actinobacteria bacterium]|nr:hypothetical protein [Actinomycetota bacterium]